MQPEVYKHIKNWQDKQMATYQRAFATGKADLDALLASDGYLQSHARGVEVRVRRKPAYSVFKQLQALQAARAREEEAKLQETVAAGAAAAAAEAALEAAAAKRAAAAAAAAARLYGKGSSSGGNGVGGGSSSSAAAPPSSNGVAAVGGAPALNGAPPPPPPPAALNGNGRTPGAPRAPKPEVGLLTHLKDLSDQGVFLQVVINERPPAGAAAAAAAGGNGAGVGAAARQQPLFQMESHQLCYYVLGLVHSIWSPIPGGLEDFIGSPKTNGYQSLHTRVVPLSILSKNCPLLPMEVQIRTADMDCLADLGVAARNWGVKRPPGRLAGWAAFAMPPGALQQEPAGGGGGAAGAAPAAAPQQQQQQQQQPAAPGPPVPDAASGDAAGAGGGARAFWSSLASYMLETVVAGGTSLAAITGVRPHFSGSPFSSRDDESDGSWRNGSGNGRGSPSAMVRAPGGGGSRSGSPSGSPRSSSSGGGGGGDAAAGAVARGGGGSAARRAAAAAAASSTFLPSALQRQAPAADGNWLTQMRKWQEEFVGSLSAREFVDGVTAEVLGQSVFVYTHTGELRRLPKVGAEGRPLLAGTSWGGRASRLATRQQAGLRGRALFPTTAAASAASPS
jgi:hypothetical protein